jgi:DNA repair ATPase RecN
MPNYFDADGNEFELAVEPDKLVETFAGLEEKDKALAENAEALKKAEEELQKLQNKDLNFKKLRDMSDAEKEKFTAAELEHKAEIEKLQEQISGFKDSYHTNMFDKQIKTLVGTDEKLKLKVEEEYKNIQMPGDTEAQVSEKLKRAYIMATGNSPSVDPYASTAGSLGGLPPKVTSKPEMSDDLKALGKNFGLTDEDLNNKPK